MEKKSDTKRVSDLPEDSPLPIGKTRIWTQIQTHILQVTKPPQGFFNILFLFMMISQADPEWRGEIASLLMIIACWQLFVYRKGNIV